MSADTHEPHVAQLIAIAELMLGAAHADDNVSWSERSAIAKALSDFVGGQLPDQVKACVQDFDPASFEMSAAVARLDVSTGHNRRELLGLVSRVVDADAELVPKERHYLERVASAIGADGKELAEFIESD